MILRVCKRCGSLPKSCVCPPVRDERPSAAKRGYGTKTGWPRIRARYLRAHPMCEVAGCSRPAVDVDHVDGSGPRGDNSDGNLQALCKPHHSRKTVAVDGGFGRRKVARS